MRLHFWVKDENEEERTQASSLPPSLPFFLFLSFFPSFIYFFFSRKTQNGYGYDFIRYRREKQITCPSQKLTSSFAIGSHGRGAGCHWL